MREVALRALNWVVALAGLVVASPLMLAVAVAIKLDSGGPVLYRQLRVGKDRGQREGPEIVDGDGPGRRTDDLGGRPFCLYRFRTMHPATEADAGASRGARGDDRTTRVGRFLRRHRLDELPQLWNVLKGDMALVGPRPERPLFLQRLRERIGGYTKRQNVRDGLTGWFESMLNLRSLLDRDSRTGFFRPPDILNPLLEDRVRMLRQELLSPEEGTTTESQRPVSIGRRRNGDGPDGSSGRDAAWAFEATLRGEVTDADDTLAELLGFASRRALVGSPLAELIADPATLDRVIGHARAGRELAGEGMTLRTRKGDEVVVLMRTKLVESGGEDGRRVAGVLVDITERRHRGSDLERLAFEDPLTGVANRRALDDHAGTYRALAERRGTLVGFLYVDLTGFEAINDRHGHAAGDAVLVEVARRLEAGARATDVVSRVGGDEFVMLLADVEDRDAVATAARRMKRTLEEVPVELPDGETAIRAEAGIAVYPEQGTSLEDLVRAADRAMPRARESDGRARPREEAPGRGRSATAGGDERSPSKRARP